MIYWHADIISDNVSWSFTGRYVKSNIFGVILVSKQFKATPTLQESGSLYRFHYNLSNYSSKFVSFSKLCSFVYMVILINFNNRLEYTSIHTARIRKTQFILGISHKVSGINDSLLSVSTSRRALPT